MLSLSRFIIALLVKRLMVEWGMTVTMTDLFHDHYTGILRVDLFIFSKIWNKHYPFT